MTGNNIILSWISFSRDSVEPIALFEDLHCYFTNLIILMNLLFIFCFVRYKYGVSTLHFYYNHSIFIHSTRKIIVFWFLQSPNLELSYVL